MAGKIQKNGLMKKGRCCHNTLALQLPGLRIINDTITVLAQQILRLYSFKVAKLKQIITIGFLRM